MSVILIEQKLSNAYAEYAHSDRIPKQPSSNVACDSGPELSSSEGCTRDLHINKNIYSA